MKYANLAELKKAFESGKLNPERDFAVVDNDSVTVYVTVKDDEWGEDSERVFNYEDLPRYLLVEALQMLGIPARQA
ncbi:hypothetical protein LCGC14_1550570 [marine sediment metagenome]|uniref:Uncharacterized protein n=1 Tax=marine sediment metagenome TaxID=412755 RepID=A0A0F9JBF0_9ZZZZ